MPQEREVPAPHVQYREQTPRIYIVPWEHRTLYEKAFLRPEEERAGEYDRNTTTWD